MTIPPTGTYRYLKTLIKLTDRYMIGFGRPRGPIDALRETLNWIRQRRGQSRRQMTGLVEQTRQYVNRLIALRKKTGDDPDMVEQRQREANKIINGITALLKVFKERQKSFRFEARIEDVVEANKFTAGSEYLDEREWVLGIEDRLKKRVHGQDHAVEAVANAVVINRLGAPGKRKQPAGVFYCAGPTGSGKTYLPQVLAEELYPGDEKAFIRIDMTRYKDDFMVTDLIGSPKGYIGSDRPPELLRRVKERPYSVIVFDEADKAHPLIFDFFLNLLERGEYNGIDFSKTMIFFTSNENLTTADYQKPPEEIKQNILDSIEKNYRPEFLNRLKSQGKILVFNFLAKNKMVDIVQKNLMSRVKSEFADELGVDVEFQEGESRFMETERFGIKDLVPWVMTDDGTIISYDQKRQSLSSGRRGQEFVVGAEATDAAKAGLPAKKELKFEEGALSSPAMIRLIRKDGKIKRYIVADRDAGIVCFDEQGKLSKVIGEPSDAIEIVGDAIYFHSAHDGFIKSCGLEGGDVKVFSKTAYKDFKAMSIKRDDEKIALLGIVDGSDKIIALDAEGNESQQIKLDHTPSIKERATPVKKALAEALSTGVLEGAATDSALTRYWIDAGKALVMKQAKDGKPEEFIRLQAAGGLGFQKAKEAAEATYISRVLLDKLGFVYIYNEKNKVLEKYNRLGALVKKSDPLGDIVSDISDIALDNKGSIYLLDKADMCIYMLDNKMALSVIVSDDGKTPPKPNTIDLGSLTDITADGIKLVSVSDNRIYIYDEVKSRLLELDRQGKLKDKANAADIGGLRLAAITAYRDKWIAADSRGNTFVLNEKFEVLDELASFGREGNYNLSLSNGSVLLSSDDRNVAAYSDIGISPVVELIMEKGFSTSYGARGVEGEGKRLLTDPLSLFYAKGNITRGDKVRISRDGEQLKFEKVKKEKESNPKAILTRISRGDDEFKAILSGIEDSMAEAVKGGAEGLSDEDVLQILDFKPRNMTETDRFRPRAAYTPKGTANKAYETNLNNNDPKERNHKEPASKIKEILGEDNATVSAAAQDLIRQVIGLAKFENLGTAMRLESPGEGSFARMQNELMQVETELSAAGQGSDAEKALTEEKDKLVKQMADIVVKANAKLGVNMEYVVSEKGELVIRAAIDKKLSLEEEERLIDLLTYETDDPAGYDAKFADEQDRSFAKARAVFMGLADTISGYEKTKDGKLIIWFRIKRKPGSLNVKALPAPSRAPAGPPATPPKQLKPTGAVALSAETAQKISALKAEIAGLVARVAQLPQPGFVDPVSTKMVQALDEQVVAKEAQIAALLGSQPPAPPQAGPAPDSTPNPINRKRESASFDYSPDGTLFAAMSDSRSEEVRLFNPKTNELINTIRTPRGFFAECVAISEDGRFLAVGINKYISEGKDNSIICIYELKDKGGRYKDLKVPLGDIVKSGAGHIIESEVKSIDFTGDGQFLFVETETEIRAYEIKGADNEYTDFTQALVTPYAVKSLGVKRSSPDQSVIEISEDSNFLVEHLYTYEATKDEVIESPSVVIYRIKDSEGRYKGPAEIFNDVSRMDRKSDEFAVIASKLKPRDPFAGINLLRQKNLRKSLNALSAKSWEVERKGEAIKVKQAGISISLDENKSWNIDISNMMGMMWQPKRRELSVNGGRVLMNLVLDPLIAVEWDESAKEITLVLSEQAYELFSRNKLATKFKFDDGRTLRIVKEPRQKQAKSPGIPIITSPFVPPAPPTAGPPAPVPQNEANKLKEELAELKAQRDALDNKRGADNSLRNLPNPPWSDLVTLVEGAKPASLHRVLQRGPFDVICADVLLDADKVKEWKIEFAGTDNVMSWKAADGWIVFNEVTQGSRFNEDPLINIHTYKSSAVSVFVFTDEAMRKISKITAPELEPTTLNEWQGMAFASAKYFLVSESEYRRGLEAQIAEKEAQIAALLGSQISPTETIEQSITLIFYGYLDKETGGRYYVVTDEMPGIPNPPDAKTAQLDKEEIMRLSGFSRERMRKELLAKFGISAPLEDRRYSGSDTVYPRIEKLGKRLKSISSQPPAAPAPDSTPNPANRGRESAYFDYSPDGTIFAVTGYNSSNVRLFDTKTNELINTINMPSNAYATCVAISEDGRFLAVGMRIRNPGPTTKINYLIGIYELKDVDGVYKDLKASLNNIVKIGIDHLIESELKSIDFTGDGRFLFVWTEGEIRVYEIKGADGKYIDFTQALAKPYAINELLGPVFSIKPVIAISEDSDLMVANFYDFKDIINNPIEIPRAYVYRIKNLEGRYKAPAEMFRDVSLMDRESDEFRAIASKLKSRDTFAGVNLLRQKNLRRSLGALSPMSWGVERKGENITIKQGYVSIGMDVKGNWYVSLEPQKTFMSWDATLKRLNVKKDSVSAILLLDPLIAVESDDSAKEMTLVLSEQAYELFIKNKLATKFKFDDGRTLRIVKEPRQKQAKSPGIPDITSPFVPPPAPAPQNEADKLKEELAELKAQRDALDNKRGAYNSLKSLPTPPWGESIEVPRLTKDSLEIASLYRDLRQRGDVIARADVSLDADKVKEWKIVFIGGNNVMMWKAADGWIVVNGATEDSSFKEDPLINIYTYKSSAVSIIVLTDAAMREINKLSSKILEPLELNGWKGIAFGSPRCFLVSESEYRRGLDAQIAAKEAQIQQLLAAPVVGPATPKQIQKLKDELVDLEQRRERIVVEDAPGIKQIIKNTTLPPIASLGETIGAVQRWWITDKKEYISARIDKREIMFGRKDNPIIHVYDSVSIRINCGWSISIADKLKLVWFKDGPLAENKHFTDCNIDINNCEQDPLIALDYDKFARTFSIVLSSSAWDGMKKQGFSPQEVTIGEGADKVRCRIISQDDMLKSINEQMNKEREKIERLQEASFAAPAPPAVPAPKPAEAATSAKKLISAEPIGIFGKDKLSTELRFMAIDPERDILFVSDLQAGCVRAFNKYTGEEFILPNPIAGLKPCGLAISSNWLVVGDQKTGIIRYFNKNTGEELTTSNTPLKGFSPAGIATSNRILYVCDQKTESVRLFDNNTCEEDVIPDPITGLDPYGIVVSGNIFFVGDQTAGSIRAFDNYTGKEKVFPNPITGLYPAGMAISGNTLFVYDLNMRSIRAFDKDTGKEDIMLVSTMVGLSICYGMAISGDTLFVADGATFKDEKGNAVSGGIRRFKLIYEKVPTAPAPTAPAAPAAPEMQAPADLSNVRQMVLENLAIKLNYGPGDIFDLIRGQDGWPSEEQVARIAEKIPSMYQLSPGDVIFIVPENNPRNMYLEFVEKLDKTRASQNRDIWWIRSNPDDENTRRAYWPDMNIANRDNIYRLATGSEFAAAKRILEEQPVRRHRKLIELMMQSTYQEARQNIYIPKKSRAVFVQVLKKLGFVKVAAKTLSAGDLILLVNKKNHTVVDIGTFCDGKAGASRITMIRPGSEKSTSVNKNKFDVWRIASKEEAAGIRRDMIQQPAAPAASQTNITYEQFKSAIDKGDLRGIAADEIEPLIRANGVETVELKDLKLTDIVALRMQESQNDVLVIGRIFNENPATCEEIARVEAGKLTMPSEPKYYTLAGPVYRLPSGEEVERARQNPPVALQAGPAAAAVQKGDGKRVKATDASTAGAPSGAIEQQKQLRRWSREVASKKKGPFKMTKAVKSLPAPWIFDEAPITRFVLPYMPGRMIQIILYETTGNWMISFPDSLRMSWDGKETSTEPSLTIEVKSSIAACLKSKTPPLAALIYDRFTSTLEIILTDKAMAEFVQIANKQGNMLGVEIGIRGAVEVIDEQGQKKDFNWRIISKKAYLKELSLRIKQIKAESAPSPSARPKIRDYFDALSNMDGPRLKQEMIEALLSRSGLLDERVEKIEEYLSSLIDRVEEGNNGIYETEAPSRNNLLWWGDVIFAYNPKEKTGKLFFVPRATDYKGKASDKITLSLTPDDKIQLADLSESPLKFYKIASVDEIKAVRQQMAQKAAEGPATAEKPQRKPAPKPSPAAPAPKPSPAPARTAARLKVQPVYDKTAAGNRFCGMKIKDARTGEVMAGIRYASKARIVGYKMTSDQKYLFVAVEGRLDGKVDIYLYDLTVPKKALIKAVSETETMSFEKMEIEGNDGFLVVTTKAAVNEINLWYLKDKNGEYKDMEKVFYGDNWQMLTKANLNAYIQNGPKGPPSPAGTNLEERSAKDAFIALDGLCRTGVLQMDKRLTELGQRCRNMKDITKLHMCVSVEAFKSAGDVMLALSKLAGLRDDITFGLTVTGVREEDIALIDSLNRPEIKTALGIPKNVNIRIMPEADIEKRANALGRDSRETQIRTGIVKDLYLESLGTQTLAKGEYLAIASDAVSKDTADKLINDEEFKKELSDNISIRVIVSPESGSEAFSLLSVIDSWFKDIHDGRSSTIAKILPTLVSPAEMLKRLEDAVRNAWLSLAAA